MRENECNEQRINELASSDQYKEREQVPDRK